MNGSQESQKLESALSANQPIGIKINENDIPYGYCHCGCGQKTNLAKKTSMDRGHIKGKPLYFIHSHNIKIQPKGSNHHLWKGKTFVNGYKLIRSPDSKFELNSRKIVENILGKKLPYSSVVHHIDRNRQNDIPSNFVVCENRGYHLLLHRRTRAYKTCGHANWRKCYICKQYDDPKNLYIAPLYGTVYHKNCRNAFRRGEMQCLKY